MIIPSDAVVGAHIELRVRQIARVLVAVYTAGFMFGRWLHRLNDRLARAYVRLLGLERPPVVPPEPPRPRPVVKAVIVREPLTVADLVAKHTHKELMVMAGTKSKKSKKQLAEKILKN